MIILDISDIILRLLLSTLVSGIIGLERERHNAHAGLRTHLLVGITATIIALIQQNIASEVIAFELANPHLDGILRSDPARLIAQVVSGIGFLGAGTIIVTKRNISGLTTAASIWSVSGLGLAIGMGYLDVALIGFTFLYVALAFLKKIYTSNFEETVIIEYVGGNDTIIEIQDIFRKLELISKHQSFTTKPFGNELIYSSTFSVVGPKTLSFESLVTEMAENSKIGSVQLTNIHK